MATSRAILSGSKRLRSKMQQKLSTFKAAALLLYPSSCFYELQKTLPILSHHFKILFKITSLASTVHPNSELAL